MTPGLTRLLSKVVKWVMIPVALMLIGYFVVGPIISEYLTKEKPETPQLSKNSENTHS